MDFRSTGRGRDLSLLFIGTTSLLHLLFQCVAYDDEDDRLDSHDYACDDGGKYVVEGDEYDEMCIRDSSMTMRVWPSSSLISRLRD